MVWSGPSGRSGEAWRGSVGFGRSGLELVRFGMASSGMVWNGNAGHGTVRLVVVWSGLKSRCGGVWNGDARYGLVGPGMVVQDRVGLRVVRAEKPV